MKRKKILLLHTVLHSFLLPLIGNLLFLILVGMIFTIGCDIDLDREEDAEPPVIKELTVEPSVINVQGIATVTAVVPPNEDEDLQYQYEWSATEGGIKNNGVWKLDPTSCDKASNLVSSATYIAPKTAGIYTITLTVCTRYAVAEKAINVEVTEYIMEFSPRVYWKSKGNEQSLTWEFNVEGIRRSPILLQYKIEQSFGQPAATLSINIDKKPVPSLKPIPKAPLTTAASISEEVDITSHINRTGNYEITFTLKTKEDIVERAWLLKNIQIVGVEGDFLP